MPYMVIMVNLGELVAILSSATYAELVHHLETYTSFHIL